MSMIAQTKRNLPQFDYENISLRLLSKDDLSETLAWRNTYRSFFIYSDEIDLTSHINWFNQYLQKDNDFIFIIENQQKEKLGQVSIYEIDWEKRSAQFGRFLVNPEFASQGYMSRACAASLQLARDVFELAALALEVKSSNERAINIYEKHGFCFEKMVDQGLFQYVVRL